MFIYCVRSCTMSGHRGSGLPPTHGSGSDLIRRGRIPAAGAVGSFASAPRALATIEAFDSSSGCSRTRGGARTSTRCEASRSPPAVIARRPCAEIHGLGRGDGTTLGCERRAQETSMIRSSFPVILLAAAFSGAAPCTAQTVDTAVWVANGAVVTMARDGGTLYLGGNFTVFGPRAGEGVVLDAGSGALSQPNPRVDGLNSSGGVLACVPDGSGGWFIGGAFNSVA